MQGVNGARITHRIVVPALLTAVLWFPCAGHSEEGGQVVQDKQQSTEEAGNRHKLRSLPLLASDEPNMLGWTRDVYEKQGFMDFTLSMRYPLFYEALDGGYRNNMLPFLSFTGRMGQYFSRHSSPVVTKRFNPKLFLRFYEPSAVSAPGKELWSDDNGLDYYDIGYAHESNGQHVDSPALFDAAVASYGSPAIAQDYISRGWDYLGYKRHLQMHSYGVDSLDGEVRYFLRHGLLQATSEEYNAWEGPRTITRISQVDGLRLKLNFAFHRKWFKGASLSVTTGYKSFGRHDTLRAEMDFTPLSDLFGVPIVVWGQTGYNNNIAQYYRRAWAVGIAAAFETFK